MADQWRVIPVEANTLATLATAADTALNTTYTVADGSYPQISVFRGIDNNFSAFLLFFGDVSA